MLNIKPSVFYHICLLSKQDMPDRITWLNWHAPGGAWTGKKKKNTLWVNPADDNLMTFVLFFSQKTGFDISCKGDNLHKMSNCFLEKKIMKYFKMFSAEFFTQHTKGYPTMTGQLACKIICIPDKLSVRSQLNDRQPAHNMLYTLY